MARIGGEGGTPGHGATPITTRDKPGRAASAPEEVEESWVTEMRDNIKDGVDVPTALVADDGGGRRVYSASMLGHCTTALAAMAVGVEGAELPDVLIQGAEEGKDAEPVILEKFCAQYGFRPATWAELQWLKDEGVIAGVSMHDGEHVEGQVQSRIMVGEGAMVRSHHDMIAVKGDDPAWTAIEEEPEGSSPWAGQVVTVEAKAFGDSLWQQWMKSGFDKLPRYEWQFSAQMIGTGLPGYFAVGHKGPEGEIIQVNAALWPTPPKSAAQIKLRVMAAEVHAKKGEFPDCAKNNWPCPVFKESYCLGKPEAAELDDPELAKLCALHHAYSVDAKEIGKSRDDIKAQIDKHLSEKGYERGTEVIVVDEAGNKFKFVWVHQDVPAEKEPRGASTRDYPSIKLLDA